jgi:hypothetical protein
VNVILRVGLMLLPFLLGMSLLLVVNAITNGDAGKRNLITDISLILSILLLFITPVWMSTVSHIIKVEQIIWIDSYFDGVKIARGQSWRIALKLFWVALGLQIHIFIRYYLFLTLITIGLIGAYIYAVMNGVIQVQPVYVLLAVLGIIIIFGVYALLLEVKLRYAWFLLVDLYKTPDFSYKKIFSDMKLLNDINKQDTFKKMLTTMIGIDATQATTNIAIGAITSSLSIFGKPGRAAAMLLNLGASETNAMMAQLAKVVASYVFYRAARTVAYGSGQYVNKDIYLP